MKERVRIRNRFYPKERKEELQRCSKVKEGIRKSKPTACVGATEPSSASAIRFPDRDGEENRSHFQNVSQMKTRQLSIQDKPTALISLKSSCEV